MISRFTTSRICGVIAAALAFCAIYYSRLCAGNQFGSSYHFENMWIDVFVWWLLSLLSIIAWIFYLGLKVTFPGNKGSLYWVKFGVSCGLFMIFASAVLLTGTLNYYFNTLTSGENHVAHVLQSYQLSDGKRLELYRIVEPPMTSSTLMLSLKQQLGFGIVREKNLFHDYGEKENTVLSMSENTAILKCGDQLFVYHVE